MNAKEAQKQLDGMADSLVEKGTLILTVSVNTKEEAEQIMAWMWGLGEDRPMKASLMAIGWDQAVVPIAAARAMREIQQLPTISNNIVG